MEKKLKFEELNIFYFFFFSREGNFNWYIKKFREFKEIGDLYYDRIVRALP